MVLPGFTTSSLLTISIETNASHPTMALSRVGLPITTSPNITPPVLMRGGFYISLACFHEPLDAEGNFWSD